MKQYKNPKWWSEQNDSGWDRVKMAMKRDWDQTKHDMGGNQPDTNQSIGHTTRQAAGKEAIPPRGQTAHDDMEPAYRFGHGARSYYSADHSVWDDALEAKLRGDWEQVAPERKQTWMQDRAAIRYGWDYDYDDDLDDEDLK
jgi:hypothetical protein